MPAAYSDLRDELIAEVDATMAETVKILCMSDGRDDTNRVNMEFEAVLRVGKSTSNNMSGGPSKTLKVGIVAENAELHVDRATYDGPHLVTGDVIVALSRPGHPRFEVRNVDDRRLGRLVAGLSIR